MKSLKPQIKTYNLRLPLNTYKELEKKAKKTMYSVNLLIIEAIKESLEK